MCKIYKKENILQNFNCSEQTTLEIFRGPILPSFEN